ncbi:MAG: low molecular weight phosphotyrosine protein phosphatase [Aphanocapsa feldmannii 277cV]|uniref:protein-tyrosine-phosphatase n=2 Tax=Aphanocapsa feldmannii TaxID=192050 RepID=A0A524RLR9_9CHRO|nr:MAG: low molecular weight phosphotyrosine protein phosphatase [Aphanocapsa feldmannii 288cV]TGG90986.1 MAG: low molecular weight phosphotyrosine protein phosphatase [Aphanocapsa feldmannii 277cV]TGH24352.1 MAG: low molecular weight phosphotyrosine protein phosphatase [Aphanocapsa feldmannii 277cI]
MSTAADPIKLLFVCLGNICRSPAAEGVVLHQLAQRGLGGRFHVDSAGTGAWHVGNPADSRMAAAASLRGIELSSRARQIEPEDLEQFDLILTMDPGNLRDVRALDPRGRSHGRIRPITDFCRRHRARAVPDPYYGGAAGFEQVLDLLEDACTGLIDACLDGSALAHRPF